MVAEKRTNTKFECCHAVVPECTGINTGLCYPVYIDSGRPPLVTATSGGRRRRVTNATLACGDGPNATGYLVCRERVQVQVHAVSRGPVEEITESKEGWMDGNMRAKGASALASQASFPCQKPTSTRSKSKMSTSTRQAITSDERIGHTSAK